MVSNKTIAVATLFFLATAMRLLIFTVATGYDEGNFLATGVLLHHGYELYTHLDNKPPVMYLIVYVFAEFFQRVYLVYALRIFLIILFSCSVVSLYHITDILFGRGGFIAGLLYAFSYLYFTSTYHTSLLEIYFVILAVHFMILAIKNEYNIFLLAFAGIASAFAVSIRLIAIPIIPLLICSLFFSKKKASILESVWFILCCLSTIALIFCVGISFSTPEDFYNAVIVYNLKTTSVVYPIMGFTNKLNYVFDNVKLYSAVLVGFFFLLWRLRSMTFSTVFTGMWFAFMFVTILLLGHIWDHYLMLVFVPLFILAGVCVSDLIRDDIFKSLVIMIVGWLIASNIFFGLIDFYTYYNDKSGELELHITSDIRNLTTKNDSIFVISDEGIYTIADRYPPEDLIISSKYFPDFFSRASRMSNWDFEEQAVFVRALNKTKLIYINLESEDGVIFYKSDNKPIRDLIVNEYYVVEIYRTEKGIHGVLLEHNPPRNQST